MIRISPEVAEALGAGQAVVALESTVIAHGLPRPRNLEVGRALEAEVRAGGAVPATVQLNALVEDAGNVVSRENGATAPTVKRHIICH